MKTVNLKPLENLFFFLVVVVLFLLFILVGLVINETILIPAILIGIAKTIFAFIPIFSLVHLSVYFWNVEKFKPLGRGLSGFCVGVMVSYIKYFVILGVL